MVFLKNLKVLGFLDEIFKSKFCEDILCVRPITSIVISWKLSLYESKNKVKTVNKALFIYSLFFGEKNKPIYKEHFVK